jgi:uncharacterized protein YjiS (DUF1127 family)
MTYVSTEARPNAGLVATWFSNIIDDVKTSARRYRSYRQTLGELQAMSNRELEDVGISPLSIQDVARQAAELA